MVQTDILPEGKHGLHAAVMIEREIDVSGCEGPSIAELRSMRVVSFVKPNNLSIDLSWRINERGSSFRTE